MLPSSPANEPRLFVLEENLEKLSICNGPVQIATIVLAQIETRGPKERETRIDESLNSGFVKEWTCGMKESWTSPTKRAK
jgi:hypothetical protein